MSAPATCGYLKAYHEWEMSFKALGGFTKKHRLQCHVHHDHMLKAVGIKEMTQAQVQQSG